VLGHPQHRYLETEGEKVAFFEKEWNVSKGTLPVKQYRARRSAEVTPRYFVDRFPMFVDRLSSAPMVTFTYVDAGAVTLEAFGTHLRAYLGLFEALPRLEFIYLGPTARFFQAAETEFYHVLYGVREQAKAVDLLRYFQVRKAWEAKERVASGDVVLLKEAQGHYAGRQFEELYEKWRKGAITGTEVALGTEQVQPSGKSVFRTIVCGSSLAVFTDTRANGEENCTEKDIAGGLAQIAANRSM
jgi:hypothetical protein